MKRILIIKTSSLGDIIHTLPVLMDIKAAYPNAQIDWVVESCFAEVLTWQPVIRKIIRSNLRGWKKKWDQVQISAFIRNIKQYEYTHIIDAQGLYKSGAIAMFAKGRRHGFDWLSARESGASILYNACYRVDRKLHAIERNRALFARVFNYSYDRHCCDYGLNVRSSSDQLYPYIVCMHATTWDNKHWPLLYWQRLAVILEKNGLQVKLPWGNPDEKQRAELIAKVCSSAEVLPKMKLTALKDIIANAAGVVAGDTGLAHLATALDVPTVALYGPTNAKLSGVSGGRQVSLSSRYSCSPCLKRHCYIKAKAETEKTWPPCFVEITPELVWRQLDKVIEASLIGG